MDIFQIFLLVFFGVLLWLIIKFVTKFLFKIALLFFIIVIAFFSYFHFSQKNIFDTMNELYCIKKNNVENFKCECFVENIINDFNMRHDSLNEIKINEIKENIFKSLYEFHLSYNFKKDDIRDCFEKNGLPGGLGEDIKNEILIKVKKTTSFFNKKVNNDK